MAQTLWSDISSLANNIQEGGLLTLRTVAFVARTITGFNGVGMNPRVGYQWGASNVRTAGEGDDIIATNLSKSTLATLTPARYADQIFISDQRDASDWDMIRGAASMELGMAFAENVESNICGNFSNLTGGTIGSAGGTLTWSSVIQGIATLRQNKVPGPYFVTLGEGQFYHLQNDVTVDASAFQSSNDVSTGFMRQYYQSSLLGVTIVTTPHVSGAAGTAAYGAVYSPLALAYDQRKAFNIRPERDESREGYELNASMWYAHGVWDAARGIQLIGTDVIA